MHLATNEQLRRLPRLMQANLTDTNQYEFIPKSRMAGWAMQLQFSECTFNDQTQKMTANISLRWYQTPEGEFCTKNQEASDLGLQQNMYMIANTNLPYSWFTPEQLEKFKARNMSNQHLKWVEDSKASKDFIQYPSNCNIWCVTDLALLYCPETNAKRLKQAYCNGLSFILIETEKFHGFHEADFSGLGFGLAAVEVGKSDAGHTDNLATVPEEMLKAKVIQVTPEMKTAALPPLPGSVKTVAAAPVLELPTVVAPPVLATPPQLPVPVGAAAPTVNEAALAAWAKLTPDQQQAILSQPKPQQSII